jgi:hypothetical protein
MSVVGKVGLSGQWLISLGMIGRESPQWDTNGFESGRR